MKPLTIEELKALPVGDWVWIEDTVKDYGEDIPIKEYRIITRIEETCIVLKSIDFLTTRRDCDYGKMWLTYKNKEQAEAKGEIVDIEDTFCCAMIGTTEQGEKYVSLEDYEHDIKKLGNVIKEYKKRLENGELIDTKKYFTKKERKLDGSCRYLICKYDVREEIYDFCDTSSEAERRLAELKGEKI